MPTAPLERHLLRARDFVDSRYAEPLDLRSLAQEAHVSPRHFSRSFRRFFGETPYQYLLTRRLERARHLLRTTEMTVGEICLEVGFTSVGSFTTTFRRHVGVSPTTFRKAYGGPSEADRIPLCFAMAWARRTPVGAFREDTAPSAD
jgi:AraC-like DNA-binding protein